MLDFVRSRWRLKSCWRSILVGDRGELTPPAAIVMADLRRFCCVDRTTAIDGTNAALEMAALEGRRQVWLHIMNRLKPDAELRRLIETAEPEKEEV